MIEKILAERIREYAPQNEIEQENVLLESMQFFVLSALAKAGFFTNAVFHGGTSLRMLHGMQRFSEDLDFLLKAPDPAFDLGGYLDRVARDCRSEGIAFELKDLSSAGGAVKKAFLKTEAVEQVLTMKLPHTRHAHKKLRIKVEVDTNPPAGSSIETHYISFPATVPVTTQTLSSGFALKCHALLCRSYVKGRDWYDFVWYVGTKTGLEFDLLANALRQQGPWANQELQIDRGWLVDNLTEMIGTIDWNEAREDVRRFVLASEQEGLDLWNREFFLYHLSRLPGS
jgi:predicted nucleotidyltransferase component of viral defense system